MVQAQDDSGPQVLREESPEGQKESESENLALAAERDALQEGLGPRVRGGDCEGAITSGRASPCAPRRGDAGC